VGDDARIAGHQRHTLHRGLGDEEAIEWIALLPAVQFDKRKAAIRSTVGERHGQQ